MRRAKTTDPPAAVGKLKADTYEATAQGFSRDVSVVLPLQNMILT